MKKGMKKRSLAMLLSLMVLISAIPMNVFAAELNSEEVTLAEGTPEVANVKVRAQAENAYLLPVDKELEVASDKAEQYGYTDTVQGAVSALDVMVAVHEELFGEEYNAETKDAYLKVSEAGYVSVIFGEETPANGFLVNFGYPNDGTASDWGGYNGLTVNQTPVTTNDTVEFMIYGDDAYYLDYYTFTSVDETVYAGEEFNVNVKGIMYVMAYMYADSEQFFEAAEFLEDAGLAWVDIETGRLTAIEEAVTDEDGNVTITAPEEEGTYYLTAVSTEYADIFLNPVKVEVGPAPATETVMVRAQAENTYLLPVDQALEVKANKAEKYGYIDNVTDAVSALDVMVAVHEEIFGEDFTAETKDIYLKVSDAGYVSVIFGVETYSNGFLVNFGYPNDGTESQWGGYNGLTVNQTPVTTNDTVEFMIYGDLTGYSDYYSFTYVPEYVGAGSVFDVYVSGTMYMSGYMYADPYEFIDAAEPLEGVGFAWVDVETGALTPIEGAKTGEDGDATITAPSETGIYSLTAISSDDMYVFLNPTWLEVISAEDMAAVEAVIEKINEIPDEISMDNFEEAQAAVKEAEEAYEALTEEQKELVSAEAGYLYAAKDVVDEIQEIKEREKNVPFVDVKDSAWYKDAATYVYARGIMTGTDETHFSGEKTVSRAQFATMIYRMAGSPEVEFEDKFSDVAEGKWYSDAIIWAYEEGIIKGYENGKFGTNDKLTREQLAVMLCRYEKNINGGDTEIENPEKLLSDKFIDSKRVSSFAVNEIAWCVNAGIISGNKTADGMKIDPQGSASRAQVATMLMRYISANEVYYIVVG